MANPGMLAILDSLTGGEVLIILVVALLVIGPERLPSTARTLGEWVSKLRKMTTGLQGEVRDVMNDPAMKPLRDVGEFVAAPRKKLAEFATSAEAQIDAESAAQEAAEQAVATQAAAVDASDQAMSAAEADAEADAQSDTQVGKPGNSAGLADHPMTAASLPIEAHVEAAAGGADQGSADSGDRAAVPVDPEPVPEGIAGPPTLPTPPSATPSSAEFL